MPLVLIPLVPVLLAFFLFGVVRAYSMTQRAQLDATVSRKPSFLKTAAFLFKASGLKWVLHVTHVSQAVTSRFALAHFPLAVRWLHGHTARVNAQARELGAISNDTADALSTLRHKTMPRAISAKVAPVRAAATHAEHTADRALGRAKAEEKARRRSISLTNKRLAGIAGLLLGADLFVFGRHARLHHRHHTRDIPRMRDHDIPQAKARNRAQDIELTRLRLRVGRLEKALGLGLLAGLVVRTLARIAPWLFCRNWKKIGNRVCGMHSGLLNLLLGAGAGMFAFAELCRLVETVGAVAARVLPKLIAPLAVAGAALCDGEHTAARPLPLETTALPSVDSPLTL